MARRSPPPIRASLPSASNSWSTVRSDERSGSERIGAEAGDVGGSRAGRRPAEAAIGLGDHDIVDAGLAPAHQPGLVEFPLLVAIGAVPSAILIMPFILEANGDAVVGEGPEVLDQAIVVLLLPFAGEEFGDRRAALEKLAAVTPDAVFGIGQRHLDGVTRIPGVFGHPGLLGGGLASERRKWRTRHGAPRFGYRGNCSRESRGVDGALPIARFLKLIGLHGLAQRLWNRARTAPRDKGDLDLGLEQQIVSPPHLLVQGDR